MIVKLIDRRFKCHGHMKWLIDTDNYSEYCRICKVCESVFGYGRYMDRQGRTFYSFHERWGYYLADNRVVLKDDKDLLRIKLIV